MYSLEQIAQFKEIQIADYLSVKGWQPAYIQAKELLYYSPFREEKTPSFRVNLDKNVFKDFGDDTLKGDVIRLVQLVNKSSFVDACRELSQFTLPVESRVFSFSGKPSVTVDNQATPGLTVTDVRPLRHPALLRYCSSRGINYSTAKAYLQEVHYSNKKGQFFAVGFANDKGGYELRANVGRDVKICTSKAVTTLGVAGSRAVNIFEGFFDFLAALDYYKVSQPRQTTIILNSTSLLSSVYERLGQYQCVNAYLDNDQAGRKAVSQLANQHPSVIDRSPIYGGYKDFNDYLKNRPP